MRRLVYLVMVALILLWTAGCGSSKRSTDKATTPPPAAAEPAESAAAPPDKQPMVAAATPQSQTDIAKVVSDFQYPFPTSGIPILMYHSIAILPGNELGLPPAKFAQQMQYLHDAGFTTINLDKLYEAYQGKAVLPKKPIVLTFDDGYPDAYSAAFPVLKQHSFTATIFVSTGGIDHGMLTWAQLKEMQDYGISVQSHSVNHLDLRTLSTAQQKYELSASKNAIEAQLNTKVNFFCYPSGKYNATTLALLKDLGYQMAVTTQYGKVNPGDNLFELKRVRINGSDSLEGFKTKVGK